MPTARSSSDRSARGRTRGHQFIRVPIVPYHWCLAFGLTQEPIDERPSFRSPQKEPKPGPIELRSMGYPFPARQDVADTPISSLKEAWDNRGRNCLLLALHNFEFDRYKFQYPMHSIKFCAYQSPHLIDKHQVPMVSSTKPSYLQRKQDVAQQVRITKKCRTKVDHYTGDMRERNSHPRYHLLLQFFGTRERPLLS
jgi:hypothetical protein